VHTRTKFPLSRRNFIRLLVLGALAVTGARGFMNSRNLKLQKVNIALGRLPSSFEGLKVGHITDIHASALVPRALIREGIDLIMSERPDVVVLTGDFVTSATKILWTTYGGFKRRHYHDCMEEISRLKAPLGVFAVLGNHDFWSGKAVTEEIVTGLGRAGVQVLRNEAFPLERNGQRLYLLGVDDYWEASCDLGGALRGVPEGTCRILLSHNPDVNEDIKLRREPIDCVLSGHTHGGQIVLPFLGAPYLPSAFGQKYRAGLVADGERQTYVSRGLGLFLVPVRLNCPADVSLLTFHKGKATRQLRAALTGPGGERKSIRDPILTS